MSLLPSHCGFSFVFGCEVSFLVNSSVFVSMIVQQLVVILVFSQEGVRARTSTLYIFFEEMSIQFLCQFLIGLFGILLMSCRISLYILDINLLSDMIFNYFLSFHRLPFHFVDCFLCYADICKFDVVLFVLFCCLWFCCLRQEIVDNANVQKHFSCVFL